MCTQQIKIDPKMIFTVLSFFLFKLGNFNTIQVQNVTIFLKSKPKNIYYPFSQQSIIYKASNNPFLILFKNLNNAIKILCMDG